MRATSHRGLEPWGYQQLFQCLKVKMNANGWQFSWMTHLLDIWKYGVKHKTMCHKGAYFCLGVPCNGAHEISDSLWYFPCVYEISWMEWAGSGQHFKVNKKRKSLLCSFFCHIQIFGGRASTDMMTIVHKPYHDNDDNNDNGCKW